MRPPGNQYAPLPTSPPPPPRLGAHPGSTPIVRPSGLLTPENGHHARIDWTRVIAHDHPDPIGAVCDLVSGSDLTNTDTHTDAGWLVMLAYGLGRVIEPKATARRGHDGQEPFPLAVVQRWSSCAPETPDPADSSDPAVTPRGPGAHRGFTLGTLRSSMGPGAYMRAVDRTLAYIAAGDIYQANIAHHLAGAFSGSIDACASALLAAAEPRYGATMVFDHLGVRHGICSASPELFFTYDPSSRTLRTEPMKGTRPLEGGSASELRGSIKDRAELDMITDLMRNDLGRVCRAGTVRVLDPRRIEAHGSGVLQASSLIEGRLGASLGLGEVIGATFPPGSVTGAPKVRAMQIIDELEDTPRGAYCGSLLSIRDSGAITASVLIRTAHIWGTPDPDDPDRITDGRFAFPVGAGIVADSVARDEWAETLTKAGFLGAALGVEIDPAPGGLAG